MVKLIELWWLYTCHRQTWGKGKKSHPEVSRKAEGCLWAREPLTDKAFDSDTLLWDDNKNDQNLKNTHCLFPTLASLSIPSMLAPSSRFYSCFNFNKSGEERKLHRDTDIKGPSVWIIPSLFPLTDIIWLDIIFFHGRLLFTHPPSINSPIIDHYITLKCTSLRLYPIVKNNLNSTGSNTTN